MQLRQTQGSGDAEKDHQDPQRGRGKSVPHTCRNPSLYILYIQPTEMSPARALTPDVCEALAGAGIHPMNRSLNAS